MESEDRPVVIQILFWVLLILMFVIGPPWGAWGDRAPPWSAHVIYLVLFVCLGLAVFGRELLPVR
jgi:4-amino-4-deoxy-L-arabinose transferase-like glycosyltransferase